MYDEWHKNRQQFRTFILMCFEPSLRVNTPTGKCGFLKSFISRISFTRPTSIFKLDKYPFFNKSQLRTKVKPLLFARVN